MTLGYEGIIVKCSILIVYMYNVMSQSLMSFVPEDIKSPPPLFIHTKMYSFEHIKLTFFFITVRVFIEPFIYIHF